MHTNKPSIRDRIRQQRLLLSDKQQAQHAIAAADIFIRHIPLKRHHHIALYLAQHGELSASLLINALFKQNKALYLPVLHPHKPGELLFQSYKPDTTLIKNKFGIQEPPYAADKVIRAQQLDLIVLPLLAFDNNGHRIGMGGGYYDRTLACLRDTTSAASPLLIGMAHTLQHVSAIQTEPWDIKLHGIVTETAYIAITQQEPT